ncbi:hypothetical protein [Anaerobaca lacustris]|uniref:PEP-CTERM sorting domain-containing protein n=1 Tax=Anaerobaca lacustris TaxID=3044600 RepID=A0AAW6U4J4_9BACT|nr:hypothetical protein [Sedimentisphaerales bacterium M17dextr]
MNRNRIAALVAVCLLVATAAQAGLILDQFQEEQNGTAGAGGSLWFAQTFTAGMSGPLARIEIGNTSGGWWLPESPPVVEIWNTTAGQPSPTVLGSVTSPDLIPRDGWLSVDFLPQGIGLTADQMYAIVLYPKDSAGYATVGVRWNPDSYGPGALWHWNVDEGWQIAASFGGGGDMQFRTYVVPVPGAAMLGMIGMGTAGWLKRRRAL